MAFGSFVSGHLVPVSWTPTGGATNQLNIKEHSFDLACHLHNVTGVKSLGVAARLAGLVDGGGRAVCDLDLLEPWYGVPAIIPGAKGIVVWGVSATGNGLQMPVIVEKVHQSGSMDKELMWDADFKISSLSGIIVFPAL